MKRDALKRKSEPTIDLLLRLAAILCALGLAAFLLYTNRRFYHDDAYISLRYAKNYLAGFGLVWNPGEYVQGYTNFLHLILVALLGRLGLNLVLASKIVGLTALVGLVGVAALFGATVKWERGAPFWHIPIILVTASAPILVWSLGGLEGTLLGLLVAGGSFLFLQAALSSRKYWLYASSGALFGLGFLTRPDGFVFFFVSLAWLLYLAWKKRPQTLREVAAYLAGAALVVTPYVIWQVSYYGDIVPNTFYAKAGSPLWLRLETGAAHLGEYLLHPPFLPFLVFASLAFTLWKRRWSANLTYLTLSVTAYLAFILLAGGDHMHAFRLLVPVIPLMSVMLAGALSLTVDANRRAAVALLTLAILLLAALQTQDSQLNPREQDGAARVGTMVGRYIGQAWPPGSLVALNSAGSTPYYAAAHRYIDMLGLNDAAIARRRVETVELPWQRVPGHLKGDGNYVLSRHPDFIILGPAEGAFASDPWFLSDLELSRDPRFEQAYAAFYVCLDKNGRETSEGGLLFIFYQRVDGPKIASARRPLTTDKTSLCP